jgi:hypothetical protein
MVLQLLIPLADNVLKNTEVQGTIEAAAITPSFPILVIHSHQALHFDVETLIVDKLVHQQS